MTADHFIKVAFLPLPDGGMCIDLSGTLSSREELDAFVAELEKARSLLTHTPDFAQRLADAAAPTPPIAHRYGRVNGREHCLRCGRSREENTRLGVALVCSAREPQEGELVQLSGWRGQKAPPAPPSNVVPFPARETEDYL